MYKAFRRDSGALYTIEKLKKLKKKMIKIELEFATGAEARQALTQLLGGTTMSADTAAALNRSAIRDEQIAENFEAPKIEILKDEKPAEETTTKKRRTKAEIEAEKAAQSEPTIEQANEGESEQPKVSTVTKEMLQEKAVSLIRNGKKEQVTATIKSFGADSISQVDKNPVKLEDYPALLDKLNEII